MLVGYLLTVEEMFIRPVSRIRSVFIILNCRLNFSETLGKYKWIHCFVRGKLSEK
jgi:hypothetical protein